MYQRIEEKYKKTSEIKKSDIFILIDFLIILIISYIFKEYHLFIFIVLLIGIIIFYLYMGIKIGYSFNKNNVTNWLSLKKTFLDYRNFIHDYDQKLIEQILQDENITKKDEVKIIIEHYKDKANNEKLDLNFWTIFSIILVVFFEIINRLDISIEQVLAYLIITIVLFVIYYFCVKQLIDFVSNIQKRKQLYSSLEEKITELYVYKYKKKKR